MPKTGWVMEWENEVAYFAPLRSHLIHMAQVFKPAIDAMRRLRQAAIRASSSFAKLQPPKEFTQIKKE